MGHLMTDAVSLKPDLGRFGVWTGGPVTPEQAVEIEKLGYGAVWIGGSPSADLSFVEPILEQTSTLQLATGIINIWSADAETVAESYHRIEKAYPGRFLLGIGVGHPEHTQEYVKPYTALVDYLDALDAKTVPTSRRVIAALGPKVLELAKNRSAGAHPYLTTPEHTAQARELVGNSVFLAPEHKVVLTTDAAAARELGRKTVGFYLDLSNYVNNWRRLGFTADDVEKPGSDKLIDSVVAYGTPESIAARLTEHLEAGADHVTIQVLGSRDELVPTLAELAPALGLAGS
jgi:probable F420-dependent oxidoreductase